MSDEDTLKALKKLGREIRSLDNAAFCLPVDFRRVRGAYNDLLKTVTKEDRR
jgi:hypothetical protein